MKSLLPIIRLQLSAAPGPMAQGAALSVITLLMGVALLGLSGWFITAAGIAGLAGIGIAFDVFRPSAGVRFFALGRTAARYGERLLTHNATLRSLVSLRVQLLQQQVWHNARKLERLRSEAILTRIVSDVDALDGVVIRLLLPTIAALITNLTAFFVLMWLVGLPVAIALFAGYLPLAVVILWSLARHSQTPSSEVEKQSQQLRRGVIDMLRHRQSLILTTGLAARQTQLKQIDSKAREAARQQDLHERRAGAALAMLVATVTGLALMVGEDLVTMHQVGPAVAAIGVFVALALAESVLQLRRGFAEFGKMLGAATRISDGDTKQPPHSQALPQTEATAALLEINTDSLSLTLSQGDTVVLTGPSGTGKTTLMMQIAGLADNNSTLILGLEPKKWPERELRDIVAMAPQRSVLIAGTIRENLLLACDASDDELWRALEAVALKEVITERGGLDITLNEAGVGFSGGQARRLVLARAVLTRPKLLLLDEPTEGMDSDTANRVLLGIRAALPETAILATLHRYIDHPIFERHVTLR